MATKQRELSFGEMMHHGITKGHYELQSCYDGHSERSGRFESAQAAADAFVLWNLEDARKELKDEPGTRDFYCARQFSTVLNVKTGEAVMFVRFRNPQRGEKLPASIIVDLIGGTFNGQAVAKTSAA
jgi:hypothetical protein